MAIKDAFKITRKTFFNPAGWLGYNELKMYNRIIASNFKEMRTLPTPQRSETFEEAMQRLNLSEEDVQHSSQRYLIYSLIFVGLAALAFSAAFVLLISYGTLAGFVLALASTAVLLAFAFRFNFWHFQIKFRKLGCTFEEWWHGTPINKDQS